MTLIWTLTAFLTGALPFSVWVGKYGAKKDIRTVADKNPGATNVYRTAGVGWFIVALIFDISKAVIPIGLAHQIFGIDGWSLLPIAIAAPLGHAISPFLNFRGGKAVATVFGVWIGLTIWTVPLIALASLLIWLQITKNSTYAVFLGLASMLVYIIGWQYSPVLVAILIGHALLLLFTHRHEFIN